MLPITAFTVSLELQGGDCSDQLTLICRHSDAVSSPLWIHNGTVESGEVLINAFPGAVYTVQARTKHTTTITGIDNVRALDGHVIQCVYEDLGNLTKSNAVKYSFIPPGQSWNTLHGLCCLTANSVCCLLAVFQICHGGCTVGPSLSPQVYNIAVLLRCVTDITDILFVTFSDHSCSVAVVTVHFTLLSC